MGEWLIGKEHVENWGLGFGLAHKGPCTHTTGQLWYRPRLTSPCEQLSSSGEGLQENRDQIWVSNILVNNLRYCPFKFTYSLSVYKTTLTGPPLKSHTALGNKVSVYTSEEKEHFLAFSLKRQDEKVCILLNSWPGRVSRQNNH